MRLAVASPILTIPILILIGVVAPSGAAASTGIEQDLSFEGKVVTSSGQNIPDGTYNMEFRIYTGCTNEPTSSAGCTPVWTEDYLNNNSQGVSFTSGTYQVNLGSICPFSGGSCENNTNTAVNWDTYPLYLSLQIGNTSNCTTNDPGSSAFTADCGGDGTMNPYILLTSVPYAENANNSNELGGVAASGYGLLAANNTWTGTNDIQNTSTTAFEVQAASGGAAALTVNTSGNNVTLGSNTDLLLQGATAYVSNSQGQTDSEAFGASADVTSSYAAALGYDATAGYDAIAMGYTASASGNYSVALGNDAAASNSYAISIGFAASASTSGIGIGSHASASGQAAIGIGDGASAGSNYSISIGYNAATTAANQLVIGGSTSSGSYITNTYIGSGVTDSTPQNTAIHATGSNTTGVAGATLTIDGGNATTGTANGGNLILQGGAASGTGTGGSVIVKPQTNSTAAFEVQNAEGTTTLLNVDTTDDAISLGTGGGTSFGNTVVGNTLGSGFDNGTIEANMFTTENAGTIDSISAYIGNGGIAPAPYNQYQFAIYSDDGGVPGNYIASSAVGTLSTSGAWYTLPVSAALTANTTYWLVYWTNNDVSNSNNALQLISPSATGVGYLSTYNWQSGPDDGLPSTFPTGSAVDVMASIYATYTSSGPALTINSSGTLTQNGAALFQDPTDSTTAFQIQNSSGADLLTADTSDNCIGIGAACSGDNTSLFAYSTGSGNASAVYGYSATGAGVVGHSGSGSVGVDGYSAGNSIGVEGQSTTGISGYFQGGASDADATLITQQNGSSAGADLFQVQAAGGVGSGTVLDNIASNGNVGIGLQNASSSPIALNVGGAIQQRGFSAPTNIASGGSTEWTEIASCNITGEYQGCNTTLQLDLVNSGATAMPQAVVAAYVYQQNAMGDAPFTSLTINGVAVGLTASNIAMVTTTNSSGSTVVGLYLEGISNYGTWQYVDDYNSTYVGWTWTPDTAFVTSLPSGAETTATYGSTPEIQLQPTSTTPTETDGAMYYNSSTNSFRCGLAGAWTSCNGQIFENFTTSSGIGYSTRGTPEQLGSAYTVPVNDCEAGVSYHIHAGGTATPAATTDEVRFYVMEGGESAGETALMGTSSTNEAVWTLDATIDCVSATSYQISGDVIFGTDGADSGSASTASAPNVAVSQFATPGTGYTWTNSGTATLGIYANWGSSNSTSGDELYMDNITIQRYGP